MTSSPARALLLLPFALLAAADWPEFRGPEGQGHAGTAEVPLSWSETENVVWKTGLPGSGWSSPTVAEGLVWLTAAAENGRSLRALAVDAGSGRLIHDVEVLRVERAPSIHQKNTHASPTPLLEDGRVYVHFGAQGTAALDASGKVLWRNQEHRYEHGHGSGGSPVLWKDLLIFNCDGTDRQFVAALDKNTGQTRWTTPRGRSRMSYATPLMIETGGKAQLVSPGADLAASYDPATGKELWRITYDGFSLVPRPLFAHGLVYITTGFYNPTLFAVRPDGAGDVTRTHIAWEASRGVPLTPSPVIVGSELYMVSDNGIAACLDARTGEEIWRKRLGGSFSASPLAAGKRIYFTNEAGETIVIQAGREYRELGRNKIDGATLASLAPADGAVYLRSDTHLYKIAE